jgi:cytoskeleton protein RodZ
VRSRGAHTFRERTATPPGSSLRVERSWVASPDGFGFMARGNFGERLKRERELREVAPNEIVVATRISLRFLEALENEDWDKLPGGIFNRGFVRAIARYLGLDEESLLAEYDLAHGDQSAEAVPAPENRIPAPPKWLAAAFVLGVLVVIAGLITAGVYGWRRYSAHRRAKQSSAVSAQTDPAAQSASLVSADPPAAGAAALDLSVSTSSATRVRIRADGKLILDEVVRAGETRYFSAEKNFEVTARDSNAVLLELNGQTMPPIGSAGASGTIVLSQKNLRPANRGNAQP